MPTAPLSERTFRWKSRKDLEALPEESTEIEADNVVKRYSNRHHSLENYCLADYIAKVISVTKVGNDDSQMKERNCSDNQSEQYDLTANQTACGSCEKSRYSVISGDSKITLRTTRKIIRYVKFNRTVDPENYFREQLMLYYPWRNESIDLLNGYDTYEKSYRSVCKTIEIAKKEYDRNTEVLDKIELATAALGSDGVENVSPNMESREARDAENEPIPSRKFSFYEPQTQEQANYGISESQLI